MRDSHDSNVDPWFSHPQGYLRKPVRFKRLQLESADNNKSHRTTTTTGTEGGVRPTLSHTADSSNNNGGRVLTKTKSFLMQISQIFHFYKSRWFVLDLETNVLHYYSDDQPGRAEKGRIHMESIIDLYASEVVDASKFALDLISAGKRYTLVTDSQENMVRWALVLNIARGRGRKSGSLMSPLKPTGHSHSQPDKRKSGLEGLQHDLPDLNNLAHMYESQGEYDKAEKMYQQILSETEARFGRGHPETVQAMSNLACLYQNQLKYEQAKQWNQKCIEICRGSFGTNHIETLQAINKLAYLYEIQGEFELAEPLYVEISEIRKFVFDDLDMDHDRDSVDSHEN